MNKNDKFQNQFTNQWMNGWIEINRNLQIKRIDSTKENRKNEIKQKQHNQEMKKILKFSRKLERTCKHTYLVSSDI